MKKLVMLLLVSLVIASCQQTNELTSEEKEAILTEVKQESQKFWAHMKLDYSEESLEASLNFFDKEAEQLWQTEPVIAIFNLEKLTSKDEFDKMYAEIFNSRKRTEVDLLSVHFMVISHEYVLEVSTGDYNIVGLDDQVYGPLEMHNSMLWKKVEEGWKIVTSHQSYRKKPELKSEE